MGDAKVTGEATPDLPTKVTTKTTTEATPEVTNGVRKEISLRMLSLTGELPRKKDIGPLPAFNDGR
ncbi:hypothetical protein HYU14_04590 [Candidatus Woesearchaeota archaeon]|nr:hypothetical protein [Candidatus Woesearchaeota archaeon]